MNLWNWDDNQSGVQKPLQSGTKYQPAKMPEVFSSNLPIRLTSRDEAVAPSKDVACIEHFLLESGVCDLRFGLTYLTPPI